MDEGSFKHNINFLGENKVCQSAEVLISNKKKDRLYFFNENLNMKN
jgi:hypothetical protein